MKYLKKFNENSTLNESVAEDYLKELHYRGAISTDVYDITREESDLSKLKGTDKEIKIKVLRLLNDVGGISTDALKIMQSDLEELEQLYKLRNHQENSSFDDNFVEDEEDDEEMYEEDDEEMYEEDEEEDEEMEEEDDEVLPNKYLDPLKKFFSFKK